MKLSIPIILFLIFRTYCFGQNINYSIINDALRNMQDSGRLIYLREELSYDEARPVIMKGKLSGGDEETKINKLVLTKSDKAIVLKTLHNNRTIKWQDNLFENSKGIEYDTLKSILYDNTRGWPYFHKNLGKGYFQFSQPLLIHNGSFALFTLIHMINNSAGYNILFVYKKAGNTWKRYIMMVLGAW